MEAPQLRAGTCPHWSSSDGPVGCPLNILAVVRDHGRQEFGDLGEFADLPLASPLLSPLPRVAGVAWPAAHLKKSIDVYSPQGAGVWPRLDPLFTPYIVTVFLFYL